MSAPDNVVEVGAFWVLADDVAISAQAREHGTIAYDPVFLLLPELDALPRETLVIDAGAFIGDTTRIFLDRGFKVAAFEPQADAFACLAHNCPQARVFNVPLGDGRMVKLDEGKGGNMGARGLSDGTAAATVTLDSFSFENVSLLKLDCEGFEPAVLAGAKQLLARPSLRHVIAEFNPQGLARHGWTVADISKHLEGWSWREIYRYGDENWDCLFTRPKD